MKALETVRMLAIAELTLLVLTWTLLPAQGQSPASDPGEAVFQVTIFDRHPAPDGHYYAYEYGTGFFIASDGTALTASHILYRAVHDPGKYQIIAIVGKEFYDAAVVCVSKLPYDPLKADPNRSGVPITRDVAEIALAPSTMPEGHREFFYGTKSGEKILMAAAHIDPLPQFPFLTIGGYAQGHVRIIGFGGISPIPYKWTVEGQVAKSGTGSDGTPVFDIQSRSPAVPGDSGAPVLNEENQVVGMWAWHYYDRPDTGSAEGARALTPACR